MRTYAFNIIASGAIAAEARDDVTMLDRMLVAVGTAQGGEQRAAEILVPQIFAVLERHVEELPDFPRIDDRVVVSQRMARGFARFGISGEGARGLAPDVACELIAQQGQRQRPVGICFGYPHSLI